MEKADECLAVRKHGEAIIIKSLCAYECVSFGKSMFNALCVFKVFNCAVKVGCQVIQSTKIYIQSLYRKCIVWESMFDVNFYSIKIKVSHLRNEDLMLGR